MEQPNRKNTENLVLRIAGHVFPDEKKRKVIPAHTHNVWSLEMCRCGECFISIEDTRYLFREGDIALIGPGVRHGFHFPTGNVFESLAFKFELSELPEGDAVRYVLESDQTGAAERKGIAAAVEQCFLSFFPLQFATSSSFAVPADYPQLKILEAFLYGIVAFLLKRSSPQPIQDDAESLRSRLLWAVSRHNGKPVTVEELAEELHYSAGYLRILVRKKLAVPPKHLIDLERIRIFKNLLLYTNTRIGEIALLTGFTSTKNFTRFFRKYTGISPRQFMHGQTVADD